MLMIICHFAEMDKKKPMTRAPLILSNTVLINQQHQLTSGAGKENDLSASIHRTGSKRKAKRHLFGDVRNSNYLTSTPKATDKVSAKHFALYTNGSCFCVSEMKCKSIYSILFSTVSVCCFQHTLAQDSYTDSRD